MPTAVRRSRIGVRQAGKPFNSLRTYGTRSGSFNASAMDVSEADDSYRIVAHPKPPVSERRRLQNRMAQRKFRGKSPHPDTLSSRPIKLRFSDGSGSQKERLRTRN